MKKLVFAVLLLVYGMFGGMAQDTSRVREHIRALSSPSMHGRGYAYHGDSIAAAYLLQQLQQMDLNTATLPYDFDVYAMEGPVTAILNGDTLVPWEMFSIAPYSHSAKGYYSIIPISPATLLETHSFESFCEAHEEMASMSLLYVDMVRCSDAERRAVEHYMDELADKRMPFKGFLLGVNQMPVWSFAHAQKKCPFVLAYVRLDQMEPGEELNMIYFSFENTFRHHKTRDVMGFLPGAVRPDSMIIVGAHYDHLGQMGDAVLFPGAHDNASGTATVLEMAHYFTEHAPRYSMLFLFFSGEEAGILGSMNFVSVMFDSMSEVKFMLNLDLLCGGDEGIMVVNADGASTAPFFRHISELNEKEHLVAAVKPRSNAANSDHYPFTLAHVPAVFVYTLGGETGGYHQPDDTSDKASLSAFPGIFQLLVKGLESIR